MTQLLSLNARMLMATRLRWICTAIGALFLICSASVCAFAETPEGLLKFVVADLPPLGIADPDEVKLYGPGAFAESAIAVSRESGMQFEYTYLPLKRVFRRLQAGTHDCTILLRTPYIGEFADAVVEILPEFPSVVITRRNVQIAQLSGLKNLKLAIPRGAFTGFPVAEDPSFNRYWSSGYAQSAKLFQAGRVDAIAGTALSLFFNLNRIGVGQSDIGSMIVFDQKPVWLQCAKGRVTPGMRTALADAVTRLRRRDAFSRIFEKYAGQNFTYMQ